VGLHQDVLIVAGGANFPEPVWENAKAWHEVIYVLRQAEAGFEWHVAGSLRRPLAYGASLSVPEGVVCIGGNDAQSTSSECFLLTWDETSQTVRTRDLPDLPRPLAYGQAAIVGETIYLAGGQTTTELDSAQQALWSLPLSALYEPSPKWREHPPWPALPRAFNSTVCQNNGKDDCLYVIGGRYQDGAAVKFLADVWEYNPWKQSWRPRAPLPQPVAAGAGIAVGRRHIVLLSGDNGELYTRSDDLRDAHPGFPKQTFAYDTISDTWTSWGPSPRNQVTTTAVTFDGAIVLPTGEIRPRVRTPEAWRIMVDGSFTRTN
jgi:N-acetylneuraminic acid mutarotase